MDKPKYVKLVIKVLDNTDQKVKWVHLCYLQQDLYELFCNRNNYHPADFNDIISRWCKEDFEMDTSMSSTKDIYILKAVIKDYYRRAHPEIYVDNAIDRQGWLRVWMTRKMKEDLNLYARK